MLKQRAQTLGVHVILIAYSALALGPILLVVMNSFKARNAIFGAPLAPPNADDVLARSATTRCSAPRTSGPISRIR